VDELTAIAEAADGRIYNTGAGGGRQELARNTPVSMNCWGFPASALGDLKGYFDEFLRTAGGQPKSECYLPMAADWFIKNKLLKIRVLPADSEWFGVTYKEDRDRAVTRIAELAEQGIYPASLWDR
jgi:hypothetical protein